MRLASREDFERAGISINPILFGLDFAIENDVTGGPYIFVSSDIPIRDPYLHFVVELNFEGGTIAKEFTVLIDPIEFSVADPAFTFRERREGLGVMGLHSFFHQTMIPNNILRDKHS